MIDKEKNYQAVMKDRTENIQDMFKTRTVGSIRWWKIFLKE
jgi:hypothetical protein